MVLSRPNFKLAENNSRSFLHLVPIWGLRRCIEDILSCAYIGRGRMPGVMEVLSAQALEREALAQVPWAAFGSDDGWREGLSRLLESADQEAHLSERGRAVLRASVVRFLVNRLEIEQCYESHPEIDKEVITAPVFSIGMVRTGTTALSFLLDQDPDNRSLLHWQAMRPCPPPETAHLHDDPRIEATAREMGAIGLTPESKAQIELLPDGPAEDLFLLGMDFKSGHFEGMFNIPSYHDWLFSADLRSAYDWHKRTLKLLQWRAPTKRWMLKFPSHSIALPTIINSYPDALFINTHRDPVKSVTSVCSLVATGAGHLTHRPDLHYIGRQWTKIIEEQLHRLIAFRDEHGDDRFIDIHNDELVRQPMQTLERLYDWMGAEMTPAARSGFEARITSSPKGVHGAHVYDPKDYGLDVDELAERFRFYTDRFDIRAEKL